MPSFYATHPFMQLRSSGETCLTFASAEAIDMPSKIARTLYTVSIHNTVNIHEPLMRHTVQRCQPTVFVVTEAMTAPPVAHAACYTPRARTVSAPDMQESAWC